MPGSTLQRSIRVAISAAAISVIAFAIHRYVWYSNLPRLASARFCGNCFLAAVGVPIELGLLGLVSLLACRLNAPWRNQSIFDWFLIGSGLLLTPLVLGGPLFAIGFLGAIKNTLKTSSPIEYT